MREKKKGVYQKYLKNLLDRLLALVGTAALSWLLLGVGIAVRLDSPGPVLFRQKRVGRNGQYFYIYKFRTMRIDTPHDMPTHLLNHPDFFITRVGRFLRKTSLDELPQLFNILKGDMALVGPRPALWNQENLISERERYGANSVRPGLTGWAQIHGRDELPPESLCAELTESGYTDMTPYFYTLRKKFEEKKIQFILDDFGTGFSNLHCIVNMNPNYVKLDNHFTAKAMSQTRDFELLKKIVELVHSIDIKICIEGVEKEEWYQKLKEIHADYLQGYLFGRPCDKNQFLNQFICKGIN